jgi:hypothetical protein
VTTPAAARCYVGYWAMETKNKIWTAIVRPRTGPTLARMQVRPSTERLR